MENELEELKEIYSEIEVAFRNKDLNGIAKYISPEFTGAHGTHTFTRDQLLENVRSQFQDFDDISWPRRIGDVHTDGDKVTVRAEGTYRAVRSDTREPVQMELANHDTWRKGPDGWQNIHSTGLEL